MKPLIVICSRDAEFYLLLSHILEVDGFTSALAGSIDDILAIAEAKPANAVMLDCRPDNQLAVGSALIKQNARTSALPCIALVSPGAEVQHIQLLQAGVDECFVRPFAPAKLLEYMRSRLVGGQSPGGEPREGKSLAYGDVEMQIDAHRVRSAGREIQLGPTEFKLLRHLLENPEKVIGRDELMGVAWPNGADVGVRTVDVYISQLRKLLKQSSGSAAIRTVRLAGYALEHRAE